MKQRVKFADLPVDLTFTKHNREHEPMVWTKVSSRTARMPDSSRVFFFGQTETVWTDAVALAAAKQKTR